MRLQSLPKTLILTNLAFLFANVIWGAATPIIKYSLAYIPPFTSLFLRFLIMSVILLPYVIIELHKTKVNTKDYANLFLLGVFSQTSLILIYLALQYTTSLDSAIISVMGGALTIAAGHYFYNEKIDKRIKIGLILASIGTVLVVVEPALAQIKNHIPIYQRVFGNLLAFLYNLTWVLYIIWAKMSMGERSKLLKKTLSFIHLKPMTKPYPPTLVIALSLYVGLLTLIPFAFMESAGIIGHSTVNILNIDPKGIAGLLYMSLISTGVAYMLYQWALENGRVSDSAIYGYVGPIFTFPVAYMLLGELPDKFLLIGCVIIAIGVYIAECGARKVGRH
jgi:drug/metabolite transporter (DMT)-like permease